MKKKEKKEIYKNDKSSSIKNENENENKIKQNPPNTAEPQQIMNKSHSHAYRKPVW